MNKMGVLNLPIDPDHNGARAKTIGEYLVALLLKLWREGDEFSGKKPFGDSGWEYELYYPLVQFGVVDGKLDDNGELYEDNFDSRQADRVIAEAIRSLKDIIEAGVRALYEIP